MSAGPGHAASVGPVVDRPGAALVAARTSHRWRVGALVGVLTAVGAALLAAGPNGAHPAYDLGLALVSGATVGLVFVVVESLLSAAADARSARSSLLLQLAITERLEGIDLSGADLRSLYLPNKRLIAARFTGADLRDASLLFADLRSAELRGVRADRVDFGGTTFAHADLVDASLVGAVLFDCALTRANLDGADLRYADLRYSAAAGASLDGADLRGAKLDQFDARGTDLRRAILDPDGLRDAVMDDSTQLPDGVEPSGITAPSEAWEPGIGLAEWLERRARLAER